MLLMLDFIGICHAGLSGAERRHVAKDFASGKVLVLVTTSAMEMVKSIDIVCH
jgi:superfamily II helicase